MAMCAVAEAGRALTLYGSAEEVAVARDGGAGDGVGGGALEQPQDHHRASDADRQRVADQLRQALDEGRLTLLEYDERLGAAYGALTYGALAKVTNDLPAAGSALPAPTPHAEVAPAKQPGQAKTYLLRQGRAWLGGAVITNGIWAATTGFDWHSYWPGVVLPIWAVVIVGGLISGNHRDGDELDKEKPRRRDRHQERIDRHRDRLGHRSLPEHPEHRDLLEPPERPNQG